MSNTKMTNAQLAQIVETQKETLSAVQMRISQIADQLALIQNNLDRFKVDVARDVKFLVDRNK